VARRLHHSRDLGEPFDFLTWFEFAPRRRGWFERSGRHAAGDRRMDLVEREVDVRLER